MLVATSISASARLAKSLHARRRERGECIYDRRDQEGPAHGPPVKGGRCQKCLDAKKESEKRRKENPDAPKVVGHAARNARKAGLM